MEVMLLVLVAWALGSIVVLVFNYAASTLSGNDQE